MIFFLLKDVYKRQDLETLVKEGLLTEEECDACDFGDNAEYIDYEKISQVVLLKK